MNLKPSDFTEHISNRPQLLDIEHNIIFPIVKESDHDFGRFFILFAEVLEIVNGACEKCGRIGFIHKHHKDFNHKNDISENRQILCPSCHILTHRDARGFSPHRNIFKGLRTPLELIRQQYSDCFPRK
jgi:5-methylcytosine-specific restriction endonuclease McrA